MGRSDMLLKRIPVEADWSWANNDDNVGQLRILEKSFQDNLSEWHRQFISEDPALLKKLKDESFLFTECTSLLSVTKKAEGSLRGHGWLGRSTPERTGGRCETAAGGSQAAETRVSVFVETQAGGQGEFVDVSRLQNPSQLQQKKQITPTMPRVLNPRPGDHKGVSIHNFPFCKSKCSNTNRTQRIHMTR